MERTRTYRKWGDFERQTIRTMLGQGATHAQIAAALGRKPHQVSQFICKEKLRAVDRAAAEPVSTPPAANGDLVDRLKQHAANAGRRVAAAATPTSPGVSYRELELWQRYQATRAPELREELAKLHVHLVDENVRRIASTLPTHIDRDELTSAAQLGFVQALDKYDVGRGLKFATYAVPRIRGAMLDAIRELDTASRIVRGRRRRLDAAAEKFYVEHGRPATLGELQAVLGWSDADMRHAQEVPVLASLSRIEIESDEGKQKTLADFLSTPDPLKNKTEREAFLARLCKGLSIEEKCIVYLYHFKRNTMKQVAAVLDLSESRVSQVHDGILEWIRRRGDRDELLDALPGR